MYIIFSISIKTNQPQQNKTSQFSAKRSSGFHVRLVHVDVVKKRKKKKNRPRDYHLLHNQ